MNLINFHGLNCYHNSIISVANDLGVDYPLSFTTLWSETDFRYDPEREVYLTRRMITNLELIGAKVDTLNCSSPEEAESSLSIFRENEYIIVGMDAFYIPWSSYYETFHGPHYFLAQKAKTEKLICFDPTPNIKNESISYQSLIDHSFDLCRVHKVTKNHLSADYLQEAQEVLRNHPIMHKELLQQIYDCRQKEPKDIWNLTNYIDAMINNRYCFRHYLQKQLPLNSLNHIFLGSDFFSDWFIVKNGMYKASVSKNSEIILDEVSTYFSCLIEKEIAIAEQMI